MNKQTPDRWTVTHEMHGIGNRQVWGIVTTDTGEVVANCGTTGEGTARFIVLACSAHADLLAALETALDICPDAMLDTAWGTEARAAIAKAKGEAR